MVSTLSELICQHLDVPRWVPKLDNEFVRDRALDVGAPLYHDLLREHDANPEGWESDRRRRVSKLTWRGSWRAHSPTTR